MILGKVKLTEAAGMGRQFVATSGTGHHLLLDDAAGNTGAKPIELVAIALAGCTAFDVINILRKKRQQVTGYEVQVEADQAPNSAAGLHRRPHPPHRDRRGCFVAGGGRRDPVSEEKYCSVGAMVQKNAELHTTFEIVPATEARPGRA